MSSSQNKPVEEQILLTVTDQSKLDLVMEMLSHFDLVRAERIVARPATNVPVAAGAEVGSEADLWALAGIWKDRDIDLDKMRQDVYERRTQHYDR